LLFAIYVDDLANSCNSTRGVYIVLYADDILLLSPTVCELQNVLHMCERELDALDLTNNVKKSCCLRIGTRNMKLLRTGDINIVKSCQSYFPFNLPSVLLMKRAEKFDIKYKNHANSLCQMVKYL